MKRISYPGRQSVQSGPVVNITMDNEQRKERKREGDGERDGNWVKKRSEALLRDS